MTNAPLCFILMPFGLKANADGSMINFDRVYEDLIAPAVRGAELAPLRADQEVTGGIIHKPMFERLILCPFAIADLTTANANVYYELGVRPGQTHLNGYMQAVGKKVRWGHGKSPKVFC